jgi:DNA-binding transcriptional LysR family regulator
MDIRLLRSFLTLANLGHYGRAADILYMTQPTLSKQIVNLEKELGGRLFERGRHGAQLTAFGALFLPDASRLIRETDGILQQARRASLGERGQLRIGFGLSTLELAPQAIARFSRKYPDIAITLNDYASQDQAQRLLAGELELGFLRLPTDTGLAVLPLMEERLALAVPAASQWQSIPISLEDLNHSGFIALNSHRGPGLAAQIQRWCNSHQFNPRVIQNCDDIQTILAIVAAGLGVAVLPCRAHLLLHKQVRMLPIQEQLASWKIGLAWNPLKDHSAVARFVEFISTQPISELPEL